MKHTQRGSVLVIVVVFVAIFGALASGYLVAANRNLVDSRLYRDSSRALTAAQSGLTFARDALPQLELSTGEAIGPTLTALADALDARYRDTLFEGSTVTRFEASVALPSVSVGAPEGESRFHLVVMSKGGSDYRVQSTGVFGECRRTVSMDFVAEEDLRLLSTYGVASRGPIHMEGNAQVLGANLPREGSVLSTSMLTMDPVEVTGKVHITGDAAVTNPDGSVQCSGNSKIDGDILIGVEEPPFPQVDTSVFEPYATNIVDSGTETSSGCYLENIRILAGTNPTFDGHCTINGVVYVESPNTVNFQGGLELTGVVVVEPPQTSLDLENHQIRFGGGVTAASPSELPAEPQYDGLRDLAGSFLLAPSYDVIFDGSFATINGSVVAGRTEITGNATGTILGSVVNYHDTSFTMWGDSQLNIDHSQLDDAPAGMQFPRHLVCVRGTYVE